MAKADSELAALLQNQEAPMSTGAPWPSAEEAEARVLAMQIKLHRWAGEDEGRRFDDLYNLVHDPTFLVVAWGRVRGNQGARTAGVDGITPRGIEQEQSVETFLAEHGPS